MQTAASDINGLRKTRDGGLLVELRRDVDNPATLTEAIVEALGDSAAVRTFEKTVTMAVMDMDELFVKDDVSKALRAVFSITEGAVVIDKLIKWIKKIAVVKLPVAVAKKINEVGRLRVGFVSCMVRNWSFSELLRWLR